MRFTIPIEPVAKGRPRLARNGRAYTPKKTRDFEKQVAEYARAHLGECASILPHDEFVSLELEFYLHRPLRLNTKKYNGSPVWHLKKPDLDNLIKAVVDGLNGILFVDDSQVWDLRAKKFYCAKGGNPRIEVNFHLFSRRED